MVGFSIIIPLDEGDYKRMEQFMLNYGLKPSDALHVLISPVPHTPEEINWVGRRNMRTDEIALNYFGRAERTLEKAKNAIKNEVYSLL